MENTSMFTDTRESIGISGKEITRLQKMLKYLTITSPLDDFMNIKSEIVEKCVSTLKREFVLKCMDNNNLQPIIKEVEKLHFDRVQEGSLEISKYLIFGHTDNGVYFNPYAVMTALGIGKCNLYMYQPRGINIELSDIHGDTQIDVQNFFNIYETEAFIVALDFGDGFRISMTPVISGGKNGEPLLKVSQLSQRCIQTEMLPIRNMSNIKSILELYRG